MSTQPKIPDSIEAFYAHALGLEYECEHRLIDLSRSLECHHNHAAACVFAQAEKMRAANIQKINQRCEKLDLPRIAPWDYYWHQYLNIERVCIDSVHYLISGFDAVELVSEKLDAARHFHSTIQDNSGNPEVKQAANEMIDLLKQEMEIVQGWKAQYIASTPLPDFDPPHQPE